MMIVVIVMMIGGDVTRGPGLGEGGGRRMIVMIALRTITGGSRGRGVGEGGRFTEGWWSGRGNDRHDGSL